MQTFVKTSFPRLARYAPRPRLFKRLDEARKCPVVWVTAPPGAGKTTLVASYLLERKITSLWYQVDEGDAEITSLFYYLGLAEKNLHDSETVSLPLLTPAYALGLNAFSKRYFEQLYSKLPTPFTVVFDNYQTVDKSCNFHEVVENGLEMLPDGGNVIIISREPPPPVFARLRALQAIAQLDWRMLRLDEDEFRQVIALYNHGSALSDASVASLQQRTGGWVTGLMLLLETRLEDAGEKHLLAEQPPQVVFDYFATEILERQRDEIQNFLLLIALLPRFTAKLAADLTAYRKTGTLLEKLFQNRYFIERYDDAEKIYQLHPLFREFLLNHLQQKRSQAEFIALQKQAAQILDEAGQLEAALDLYCAAQDWPQVSQLITRHAPTYFDHGRIEIMGRWLEQIPPAVLESSAWLVFWQGVCRMFQVPLEGRMRLQTAYRLFKQQGDVAGMGLSLACIVDTFSFGFYDYFPLDEWIAELELLLSRYPKLPTADLQTRVTVAMFVALMYRCPQHADLPQWEQRTRRLASQVVCANERVIIYMHLSTYYVWWGRNHEMAQLLADLRPVIESDEISSMGFITFQTMATAYYTRAPRAGDAIAKAVETLQRGQQSGILVMQPLLLSLAATACMQSGRTDDAAGYLDQMAATLQPEKVMDQLFYHHNCGHLAWLNGDIDSACDHAGQCVELAKSSGSVFHQALAQITRMKILLEADQLQAVEAMVDVQLGNAKNINNRVLEYECLLVAARMAMMQHDEAQATIRLREALGIMRETDSVCTLWMHPDWLRRIVTFALKHTIEVSFVQSLIQQYELEPLAQDVGLTQWPWPVKIKTLGGFSLTVNGEPVATEGKAQKKPVALLKVLIALGGDHVCENMLTDALWPEAGGDDAHNSLKTTLRRLRRLLGSKDAIIVSAGTLSLNPRYCWSDVRAFEQLLDSVPMKHRQAEFDNSQVAQMTQAIQLYTGAFLPEEMDASWAFTPAERLRTRYLRAVEKLAGFYSRMGDAETAREYYEAGINIEPLAESLYLRLIECLVFLNHRAEALTVYNHYSKLLRQQFDLEPSADIRSIVQQIKPETSPP